MIDFELSDRIEEACREQGMTEEEIQQFFYELIGETPEGASPGNLNGRNKSSVHKN